MALKPVHIWFADRFSDANWNSPDKGPGAVAARETALLAADDLGLGPGDGAFYFYRVLGDATDDKLGLSRFQLPQLLFSTPVDPSDPAKGSMFLAKLVQGQITRGNVATMLKAVRQLEPKLDPSGKVTFYNPSLTLPALGISNSASAPGGGYLLGLNPFSESITVNRYGQVLDNLLHTFSNLLPWVVGGWLVYEISKRK